MEMPYEMPMEMHMDMPMEMPMEMPMQMPMDTMGMSSAYVRAAQKYNEYGVPLSTYRKGPRSPYEMENTMSGSNYLDGTSITTPISSTGDGTRRNQLYDIRPQPAIGLGDPLKDYTTNPNPILNNGLY